MLRNFATAVAVAVLPLAGVPARAQVSTTATPRVGGAEAPSRAGPLAPSQAATAPSLLPRSGPLPSSLTLVQALEEAEARSPALNVAQARVAAAAARIRQAGVRSNPELSIEVENFLGTGELSGLRGVETTVALNQRLDLGGRRRARVTSAQAELAAEQVRLAIARADLAQSVREQFARSVVARERLLLAQDNEERSRELARIAQILVDNGREPPLRALRARSAATQAAAELEAARAEERSSRSTLSALFGATNAVERVSGELLDLRPRLVNPEQSLEVRLAEAERIIAEAALAQEQAATRLDPAVGIGVRHVREAGAVALVGGVSLPLPVFDRNRGNIEATRAGIRAAEANLASVRANVRVRAANAVSNVQSATTRVEALQRSAVPEASEGLRLTRLAYIEGRASLVELLDAQSALRQAQASLIDARLAQALATAELGRVAAQQEAQ